MDKIKKQNRYERIYNQLDSLVSKSYDMHARMATIIAVLHYKMDYFFWTGFYLLNKGELVVRSYQGPVACQVLEKNTGVCWAGINQEQTILVPDVNKFPGHIACDSRSQSEIVVPFHNREGGIIGVLDVDSKDLASFDEIDSEWLNKIVKLVWK